MSFGGVLPPLIANTTSLQAAVGGSSLGVSYGSGGFLVWYLVGGEGSITLAVTLLIRFEQSVSTCFRDAVQQCPRPRCCCRRPLCSGALV